MTKIGYASVEDFEAYVNSHYCCDDDEWKAFYETDASHHKVALTRAFEAIECLPIRGCKTDCNQSTNFPRYPDKEVPLLVVAAQCAEALSRLDKSAQQDLAFVEKLQRKGVKSYKIGPISETFGDASLISNSISVGTNSVGVVARGYLQNWLAGGYRIGSI